MSRCTEVPFLSSLLGIPRGRAEKIRAVWKAKSAAQINEALRSPFPHYTDLSFHTRKYLVVRDLLGDDRQVLILGHCKRNGLPIYYIGTEDRTQLTIFFRGDNLFVSSRLAMEIRERYRPTPVGR